jgi:membrane fusion protein, copper/silver efflux system
MIVGGSCYYLGHRGDASTAATKSADVRDVLCYYVPMFWQQQFDKPGKSQFMDMELNPKYADNGGAVAGTTAGVSIDPSAMQNLGIRVVAAQIGSLAATLNVAGSVDFNQRDVAIIQARSGGFVSRVYLCSAIC